MDGNTVYFDDIITPFNRTEVGNLKEEWYFDNRSTMDEVDYVQLELILMKMRKKKTRLYFGFIFQNIETYLFKLKCQFH